MRDFLGVYGPDFYHKNLRLKNVHFGDSLSVGDIVHLGAKRNPITRWL